MLHNAKSLDTFEQNFQVDWLGESFKWLSVADPNPWEGVYGEWGLAPCGQSAA